MDLKLENGYNYDLNANYVFRGKLKGTLNVYVWYVLY